MKDLHTDTILYTHCSKHMDRTLHIYRPINAKPLTCLECQPDQAPAEFWEWFKGDKNNLVEVVAGLNEFYADIIRGETARVE